MSSQRHFLWCCLSTFLIINVVECGRRITSKQIYNLLLATEKKLSDKIANTTEQIEELESKLMKPPQCPLPMTCVPGCSPGEICINLDQTGQIQGTIPGFSIVSNITGLTDGPCSRQGVFKVHFLKHPKELPDICFPKPIPTQRMLKIQMYYSNGARDGWTFDVGDSQSNNGWAGDAGHQDFSAEIQGLGKNIHAYANTRADHHCNATNLYGHSNAIDYPVSVVNHWISNHFWKVTNDNGLVQSNCNPCLFGLQGQNDVRGPENEDIFVAGNRVIHTNTRNGKGLCFIKMRWVDGPDQ